MRYDEHRGYRLLMMMPLDYTSASVQDHIPLYVPLPNKFHGDRINSYNGFIRYKCVIHNMYMIMFCIIRVVNYDRSNMPVPFDNRIYNMFPTAVLIGNERIVLEHFPTSANMPENGRLKIRLREVNANSCP